jgi:PAS domain S-box-containing protein
MDITITGKPIKVLIIEDNLDDQVLTKRLLDKSVSACFEITLADRLEKGIKIAIDGNIDIILLDLNLPDSSGVETFLKLKLKVPGIPIVVLSGTEDEEESLKAVKHGAQDYLVKNNIEGHLLARSLRYAIERKNIEMALQISEENFRNSLNNSPLGIRIVSEDGETLYTNQAFLDIYRYKNLDEFKNTPVKDRYTPDSYIEFYKRREKRWRSEPLSNNYEISIVRKDGEVRHLQVLRKEIIWEGKQQYQTIYRDITEEKLATMRLDELNNIMHLITDINKLIVKTDDEMELLRKACNLFVESRQYPLAWIGFKQEGSFDILPVTECGEGIDYLSSIKITWDDSPFGQGPTGTAIKTGKLNVIKDMRDDPRYQPWREKTQKWGFKSSVALPLTIQNQVIGALNIYSESATAFDEKELNLLEEIAGDLSLGIEKIRRREQQLQIENAIRLSEQKFHNSLDTSPLGILIGDDKEKYYYVNKAFLDIYGYQNIDEVKASPLIEHYTAESFAAYQLRQQKIANGEPVPDQIEFEVVHKDGTVRHIQAFRRELVWADKLQYQITYNDITAGKLAEKALKQSELNFRNSMDSSSIGIRIGGQTEATFYANQALLDIFGYKNLDEIQITPPYKYYSPESYASFLLRHEKFLRGEPMPKQVQIDILRKDGTTRNLQVSMMDIFWDGKQQYQTLYNDVTELKQAESALRESEKNLRTYLENAPDGVYMSDLNGVFLDGNNKAEEILGYKKGELIGSSFLQLNLLPGKYLEKARESLKLSAMGRNTGPDEFELIRKDKSHIWVEINTATIKQKENNIIIGFVRDITERKRAEEAQHQSDEKYRLIVENSSDIIFTTNALEEFAYVSPSVTNVLGYNPAELIGKHFISLIHPDDLLMMQEEIQRSYNITSKFGSEIEYRVRRINGEWRWVISKGTRVVDVNGNFIYFIGIMRDTTTLKQAEKERRQLEDKAQVNSRLAAVGEMAAGVAHEINNPLTGVLGFSQMLLEKENVPEDIKVDLKLIADGSQRVADIVKRLLTFARQTKPVRTLANINDLIDNTLKLRDYVLKTSNIEVITRFDKELPLSVVDPGQMQQVFLNLIVNAEQAMKKANGKGMLTIITEKTGNFIRISFQDDGPGITKDNMGHIFEPFFTTKDVGEGTGLGLSLSRSIILEHGGRISIESEVGHGATFIIELPVIESPSIETTTSNQIGTVKSTATKKGKILVVDDEPGVRALLEKVLIPIGYQVDTIIDAKIALDKIDSGAIYDVILLDIRMPGMSGTEFYGRIVENNPNLKGKVIIITGDVMGTDIKDFLKENNLPYLVKPFDINLMKEKINMIIGVP